ncbi:MAG: hypothetical protein Q4B58_03330 [Bacteroidales bacterium]|nr:hypothetical protein [Bacteroidales bacterium]
MAELEDGVFDDAAAVKYIQEHLPQDARGKFTDDEVLYISDSVFDYYESNGLLDADEDEEVDIDMEDLTEFVMRSSKKHGFSFDPELVRWVIECEMDYEESLA